MGKRYEKWNVPFGTAALRWVVTQRQIGTHRKQRNVRCSAGEKNKKQMCDYVQKRRTVCGYMSDSQTVHKVTISKCLSENVIPHKRM